MATFLSQEYLNELVSLASVVPVVPGANARLQHVITGAPNGATVRYHEVVVDGKAVSAQLGEEDADLVVRSDYSTALDLATGRLPPQEAVGTGRVKVHGDVLAFLRLLPVFDTPGYIEMHRRLAERLHTED